MSNSFAIGGVVALACPILAIKLFEVVKKYGPKAGQQIVNTTSRVWNAVSGLFSRGGARVGTDFGKLGTLIENRGGQVVNWTNTNTYALNRMAERGVTQGMINAWVSTGKALQQSGNKIIYITQQGAVVIDNAGRIVTAYTSQYFDATMQEVVRTLFGG
ncbi:MAG: hypothetical protein FWC32_00605 [Firmicutes bacterium]|nr:hypothetical protein [Bacillota bacterium]